MHHCVLKEHEVHGGDQVVVGHERLLEQLAQHSPVRDGHVLGLADALRKVAENVGLLQDDALVQLLQNGQEVSDDTPRDRDSVTTPWRLSLPSVLLILSGVVIHPHHFNFNRSTASFC